MRFYGNSKINAYINPNNSMNASGNLGISPTMSALTTTNMPSVLKVSTLAVRRARGVSNDFWLLFLLQNTNKLIMRRETRFTSHKLIIAPSLLIIAPSTPE